MKLLIAVAVAASAATMTWTMKYSLITAHRDKAVVSVEASANMIRLCVEVDCAILNPAEASEVARVLLARSVPRGAHIGKFFDELAEESAAKTDAEFCARAKTEWERKAFCR